MSKTTMKLTLLLKELQKDFELKEPFVESSSGVFEIPLGEGQTVRVLDTHEEIVLSSSIIDTPLGKEEDLYLHMLSANLFGQGTKGAVLGLSDDGRRLTLSRAIDYDVDFTDFKGGLEDFIDILDFWRDEALTFQP